MVERLAEHLDVPLRDRNTLLLAAGFAPQHAERALDHASMGPVREALDIVLRSHQPYPAAVVDRHWNLVSANAALGVLIEGVDPTLLAPPINVLRASLHPLGMAPRIRNFEQWRDHLLHRLARQVALTDDPHLTSLRTRVAAIPHRTRTGGRAVTTTATGTTVPTRWTVESPCRCGSDPGRTSSASSARSPPSVPRSRSPPRSCPSSRSFRPTSAQLSFCAH